jgi:hypothetical protein
MTSAVAPEAVADIAAWNATDDFPEPGEPLTTNPVHPGGQRSAKESRGHDISISKCGLLCVNKFEVVNRKQRSYKFHSTLAASKFDLEI